MAIQFSFEKIMSMSTKDILKKVDVSNLDAFSRSQQAAIVRKVGSAMNKRRKSLKSLKKKGVYSAAYEDIKSQRYFSTKGKGSRALKTEFKRIKKFGTSTSGTVKGSKAIDKAIAKKAKQLGYPDMSPKQRLEIGLLWQKMKDEYPEVVAMFYSSLEGVIQRCVHQGKLSVDEVLEELGGKQMADKWRTQRAHSDASAFTEVTEDEEIGPNPFL